MGAMIKINDKIWFTPEGGCAIKFINDTGALSVKGTSVRASRSVDDAVEVCPANDADSIGSMYEDGIPNGSDCLVVVGLIAEMLAKVGTAATRGNWVKQSDANGAADATNTPPVGGTVQINSDHFREKGHCLQSVASGLFRAIIHHN